MAGPDDARPATGPGQASGTGWVEADPGGSLAERLAHLESLDPDAELPDFADDEEWTADEEPAGGPAPAAAPAVQVASVAERAAEQTPASVPGMRRARRRPAVPVVVLAALTTVAAVVAGLLWLDVRSRQQAEDARREGLAASRDAARLLFSYDYRSLDKDFAAGRMLTTGRFRSEYDKTTTKVVADVAKRYQAVVRAEVVTAGVVRASAGQVVTIVYVNQVTTSTQVKGSKVDLSRVRMTLVRQDGRWLVTQVDAL